MVRAMLSESLSAVISQTLLKTKDGAGRVAAHEIMIGTPAIRNLIREDKVAQMYSAIQTGSSVGMQTLDQNLPSCVKRNIVSRRAEARGKAKFAENFEGRCSLTRWHARASRTEDMEREQAIKFIHDLLRPAGHAERLRPLHHRRLSAGDQGRRQDHAGLATQPLAAAHARARARDDERQAGGRVRGTKECNFAISPPGIGRFRVNAFVQQGRVGMVLRTITTIIPKFEDLDLPRC